MEYLIDFYLDTFKAEKTSTSRHISDFFSESYAEWWKLNFSPHARPTHT